MFVLLLATTGIALNHSDRLGLPDASVPEFVAHWYFGDAPTFTGYAIGDNYLYRRDETLYLDRQAVTFCQQQLQGAVTLSGTAMAGAEFLALCDGELILISADGEQLERLGTAQGLPEGLLRIGRDAATVLLADGRQTYALDLLSLASEQVDATLTEQQQVPVPAALLALAQVSWEQFMLDLHSGKLLGDAGVVGTDFIALLLIAMSLSGVFMWWRTR